MKLFCTVTIKTINSKHKYNLTEPRNKEVIIKI